jgi:hypothetical protein
MTRSILSLAVIVSSVWAGDAFSSKLQSYGSKPHDVPRITVKASSIDFDVRNAPFFAQSFSCTLKGKEFQTKRILPRLGRSRRKTLLIPDCQISYEANVLELNTSNLGKRSTSRLAIILIHPIGVGIGRWYYDRLLVELKKQESMFSQPTTVIAPDLLACGSASEPDFVNSPNIGLPLFTVSDWSSQVLQLMEQYETLSTEPVDWILLSNGGCVPIALDAAAQVSSKVSQVILSAPPSLASLVRESPPPPKVRRAYNRLSGIVGNTFWWYALRKNGKFIQTFSEKNLAADPANLGEAWTPNCVATCRRFPNSRYSTFAFLAGALQLDCREIFETRLATTQMDVILGGDSRRNPAKSWFWDKKRTVKKAPVAMQTVSEFLHKSGNGGRERIVGGRRCPAHEDASCFAEVMVDLIESRYHTPNPTVNQNTL